MWFFQKVWRPGAFSAGCGGPQECLWATPFAVGSFMVSMLMAQGCVCVCVYTEINTYIKGELRCKSSIDSCTFWVRTPLVLLKVVGSFGQKCHKYTIDFTGPYSSILLYNAYKSVYTDMMGR